MKFLHFTNWDASKIDINKEYYTYWEVSKYWRQKLEGNWVNLSDGVLYELPNIVIDGINLRELSKYLKHLIYTSELLKEYIFEEVRVNKFSGLPSRKRCMFLFDPEIDYKEYAKVLEFSLQKYNLIEIEVSEVKSKLSRADMSLLNCNPSLYDEIVSKAEEYWKGTGKTGLNTEILFEGEFKIKRIILQNLNHNK